MARTIERIPFQRGHLRSEVLVGSGALGAAPWPALLDMRARHFLVADAAVYAIYGSAILSRLQAHGDVVPLLVAQGEAGKGHGEYLRVAQEISRARGDRNSTVISLGGASTNNVAGFAAATVMRGLRLVHIPTTLLAQLDGAIDFKQSINCDGVKNLIGAFYAPSMIVVDPMFLQSLASRHLWNGCAEAIKHGLIQDSSFVEFLEKSIGNESFGFWEACTRRTIRLKVRVMESDRYEQLEMLLQYGHAFGHALESASRNELLHGEAISIGMCLSAGLALKMGVCSAGVVEKHIQLLEAYRLPTRIPAGIQITEILAFMARDKYKVAGKLLLALPAAVGRAAQWGEGVATTVDESMVREVLQHDDVCAPRVPLRA